jgi:F-box-like
MQVLFGAFTRLESRFNHFRTVIHNPNARIAAIYAIDKEIDEQLKAVDAAKQFLHSQLARLKALTPISLLPPEILARVFHLLAFEDPACSRKQNLGWIRATHVCRLWRQVALDDSSLWATISGISANTVLISEMLARSRNAPLNINIRLGGTSVREVLRMFLPHLSNTRELRFHGPSMRHTGSVRGFYSREAPALEHFELMAPVESSITFRDICGTTLFKGQAPKLRTFSLSQVLIPWSLIPRGQLTRLKIVLFREASITDTLSCGDLDQLIDLLVSCPGLEVLALGRCLPSHLSQFPYTQFPHSQTIHLPFLSRLCLVGSSSRITNLLKMLKLPPSTRLHLRSTSENASAHDDHLLLPVISAHLQGHAPVEFKSLNVTLGGRWQLEVTASTSVLASRIRQFRGFGDEMDDDDNDELVLSFDWLSKLSNKTDLLERVRKMLYISNLEFLSICASDSLDWIQLFKRCKKLTTLQVMGSGTSSLVRTLSIPKAINAWRNWDWKKRRDSKDNTPAQLARNTAAYARARVFPKLECLSLKELDFSEKEHDSGILFDVVDTLLRQRKVSRNAPLRMLRIDDCAISARRARALQKLVEEFHWDGSEVFFDYENFDYFSNGGEYLGSVPDPDSDSGLDSDSD